MYVCMLNFEQKGTSGNYARVHARPCPKFFYYPNWYLRPCFYVHLVSTQLYKTRRNKAIQRYANTMS